MEEEIPTKSIIKSLFLIEFYEKKTKDIQLLGEKQIAQWIEYFDEKEFKDIAKMIAPGDMFPITWYDLHNNLCESFRKNLILYEILMLCEGKLSLYGLSFLAFSEDIHLDSINLIFDSCTIAEATKLLLRCLSLFDENARCYTSKEGILISHFDMDIFFSFNICENKGQILRNITPSVEQHIWNPIDGYITTFSGAMALSMSAFPLNMSHLTYQCTAYNQAGFQILFYGADANSNEDMVFDDNYDLVTSSHPLLNPDLNIVNIVNPVTLKEVTISDNLKYFKDIPEVYILPKDCCEGEHKSCVVGIDDDRYVVLNNIRRTYNLNKDIFGVLCSYCLLAEANLAKDRLLKLEFVKVPHDSD